MTRSLTYRYCHGRLRTKFVRCTGEVPGAFPKSAHAHVFDVVLAFQVVHHALPVRLY
jgi:hypothetical protein